MWRRRVALVRADASQENIASILPIEILGSEEECRLMQTGTIIL
jgi:hypothetical protein